MIHDIVRWEEKAIIKAASDRNIALNVIDVRSMDMNLNNASLDQFGDAVLQRCASYYRGLHSTAFLEYNNLRVVNSLNSIIVAGNKMLTSLSLVKNKVPTPKTSVSTSSDTAMMQFQQRFGGRVVIKPVIGSWGRLIGLLNDKEAASAVFEDREYMYPLYSIFYLQEFVRKPGRDIRIFVVGDRVIGGMYRYEAQGDWRTNTAIGGRAEKCQIDSELEDIAIRAARSIGKGIYGIDIMESEEGYLVHEINSTTEFKNTVRVTNVDIPGEILNYLKEEAS